MFNSVVYDEMDQNYVTEPNPKRKKLDQLYTSKLIHSSLEYRSIKAPPCVVYKSLDSYCENNCGNSLFSTYNTPSTSSLKNLQSVSSPIILKTPRGQQVKKVLNEESMPHILFTVEELSLVKSLNNWTNTKVSAVGQISLDTTTQKCYLNSVCESGQWSLMLDTLLLAEIPKLQQLLQVYGLLVINGAQSCMKVYFTRSLSWVELPLFVNSYTLMQKQIVMMDCSKSRKEIHSSVKCLQQTEDLQMNDTLDDCSLLL